MNTKRRGSCEFQRFLLIAQRACCTLAQLLHVGDSLEQDVSGASAAGAHTVWLNREGLTNDTGIKADYEISSLTDLPEILGVECQGHLI